MSDHIRLEAIFSDARENGTIEKLGEYFSEIRKIVTSGVLTPQQSREAGYKITEIFSKIYLRDHNLHERDE